MNRNEKIILFIGILALIFGCTKEDVSFRLSEFDPPIITGYQLRDFYGEPMGIIGTPNIKLGNESNERESEYFFSTYPNPCENRCSIYIKAPSSASKKNIWIVQALFGNDIPADSYHLGSNTLWVGGTPVFKAELMQNRLTIDISDFMEGFYRVYLRIDDHLLYDNLVISNN